MVLDTVVSYAIYPGIGIARVGNSPDEFFVSPDLPGHSPTPPFKDLQGRVKRQAALFRVFGLDANGQAVQEITDADAKIDWRVHIANRKAGWYQFNNAMDLGDFALESTFRNMNYVGADRAKLVIDPGPRSISGINQQGMLFDTGECEGVKVYLGELRTDDQGRLLVLGGRGLGAAFDQSSVPATTFANNDGWYDDVSDGPVRAVITVGNQTFEAEPATVVVTPPNFAPGINSPVTMYDVVIDLYTRQGWIPQVPKIIFTQHIRPILHRMVDLQWVNQGYYFLFGANSPSEFTLRENLLKLADPSPLNEGLRKALLSAFRDPSGQKVEAEKLPPMYGDGHGDFPNTPFQYLSITHTQHEWLERWALGDFENDLTGFLSTPAILEDLPVAERTAALDRSALEQCLGGPFHPGIEITWIFRLANMWKAPFRLNIAPEGAPVIDDYGPILRPMLCVSPAGPLATSGPGSITRWTGVPWHTDAASCLAGYDQSTYLPLPAYWPARVPNTVYPLDGYQRAKDTSLTKAQRLKHFDYRLFWMRDLKAGFQTRINNMIAEWDLLGIVTRQVGPIDHEELGMPAEMWVEIGRSDKFSVHDASLFQLTHAESPLLADFGASGQQLTAQRTPQALKRVQPRSST